MSAPTKGGNQSLISILIGSPILNANANMTDAKFVTTVLFLPLEENAGILGIHCEYHAGLHTM